MAQLDSVQADQVHIERLYKKVKREAIGNQSRLDEMSEKLERTNIEFEAAVATIKELKDGKSRDELFYRQRITTQVQSYDIESEKVISSNFQLQYSKD